MTNPPTRELTAPSANDCEKLLNTITFFVQKMRVTLPEKEDLLYRWLHEQEYHVTLAAETHTLHFHSKVDLPTPWKRARIFRIVTIEEYEQESLVCSFSITSPLAHPIFYKDAEKTLYVIQEQDDHLVYGKPQAILQICQESQEYAAFIRKEYLHYARNSKNIKHGKEPFNQQPTGIVDRISSVTTNTFNRNNTSSTANKSQTL